MLRNATCQGSYPPALASARSPNPRAQPQRLEEASPGPRRSEERHRDGVKRARLTLPIVSEPRRRWQDALHQTDTKDSQAIAKRSIRCSSEHHVVKEAEAGGQRHCPPGRAGDAGDCTGAHGACWRKRTRSGGCARADDAAPAVVRQHSQLQHRLAVTALPPDPGMLPGLGRGAPRGSYWAAHAQSGATRKKSVRGAPQCPQCTRSTRRYCPSIGSAVCSSRR
jgi:hypothetical protein